MDPYGGYGYIDDGGYGGGYGGGGGGYIVEAGPQMVEYGGGYGPPMAEYGGGYGGQMVEYQPQYVEQFAPQPYVEEIYAPAYLEPYAEQQAFMEPYYGYEDPYAPYIDGLVDMGYNGPWPANYYGGGGGGGGGYGPFVEHPRERGCRKRGCERSCRCKSKRRCESSDSDSSEDERPQKHVHKHCHHRPMMPRNNNNGITKDDIQSLLDKFETALNLKYKRAQVEELDAENQVLKSLAKEKREIKKQVAQAKRDLLLKDALDFNRGAPVPGRRQGQGQQVVSIDFGNQGQQPPTCPPGTRPMMAPHRPHAPPQPSIIYH